MPTPNPNETEDDYMQRCMAYPDMQKHDADQRSAICHSKFRESQVKGAFARFPSMEACKLEMSKLGHIMEDALDICRGIAERAAKGTLLKAEPVGIEVLSKASDEDIVLGGNAQWEIKDDDGDTLTAQAQVKAFTRFFNQPPEFQLVTLDHAKGKLCEVKAAQPQLKYVNSEGKTYYSHVHEVGSYFVSKIRNDNLPSTQFIRSQAKAGNYNGYSVNVIPLERDPNDPHRVLDAEYTAITITTKGVMRPRNPKTRNVEVISKANEETLTENPSLIDTEMILQKHGFTHAHTNR